MNFEKQKQKAEITEIEQEPAQLKIGKIRV